MSLGLINILNVTLLGLILSKCIPNLTAMGNVEPYPLIREIQDFMCKKICDEKMEDDSIKQHSFQVSHSKVMKNHERMVLGLFSK